MILLIIILILLFGLPIGYYGNSNWGPYAGGGGFLGTLLIIVLICYLLRIL